MPNQNPPSSSFRNPFVAALLGGAIVAALGWIAIAAGLIQAEGGTTTIASPVAAQVADGGSGDGDSNLVNQIYKTAGNGVAFIEAEGSGGSSQSPSPFGQPQPEGGGTATGSGFVIDTEGHVVTNYHVVEGADQVRVKLGDSDTAHDATVVGSDPANDVAVLDVEAPAAQLHPLSLGSTSEVEVGDPVVAIGNPFGLDRTVTSGIVSALQRQIAGPSGYSISNVIQTDAAINPGNSGGPLINAAGEVIGINSQIQTGGTSRGNVGIGFAVPIDTVRDEIDELIATGEVSHAFLGISGGTITARMAEDLNLSVSAGVLVQEVVAGGPADKAGVKAGGTSATVEGEEVSLGGDIIVKVDGKQVTGMDEVIEIVNGAEPGDKLELTVVRDEDRKTLTVTLGERPDSPQETE